MNRAGAILRLATLPRSRPSLLPQCGRGAGGEGYPRCGRGRGESGPHLPPCPLPIPSGARKGGGREVCYEEGEMNRAGAILRLATLPRSRPSLLPQCGRGAGGEGYPRCGRGRGEGGPSPFPLPLPLPPGARKGGRTEQGRSCGWQRYRVHDPPFSRSAGEGPGVRATHAAGEEGGRARGGAKARWHSLTQWLHGYGTCPLRKLGF